MNPLEQLRDIHLSEPIAQWPPAYGWWILLLIVIAVVIFSISFIVRHRRRSAAKRQALEALQNIDGDADDWPQKVNGLLKRLALSYYPNEQVAKLHGDAWLAFLSQRLSEGKRTEFETAMGEFLTNLYQPSSVQVEAAVVVRQTELWIKRAVPPKKKPLISSEVDHV